MAGTTYSGFSDALPIKRKKPEAYDSRESNPFLNEQMPYQLFIFDSHQSLYCKNEFFTQTADSPHFNIHEPYSPSNNDSSSLSLNMPSGAISQSRAQPISELGVEVRSLSPTSDPIFTPSAIPTYEAAPPWLEGLQLIKDFIREDNNDSRFWHKEIVQTESLLKSVVGIVGRFLILSQSMMALPSPEEFDYLKEAKKFNCLLCDFKKDAFKIYGGYGCSKRLLHAMSQVTCFTARLQQDPESIMLPRMAQCLQELVMNMKQWNPESTLFEQSHEVRQPIEWVRDVSTDYRILTLTELIDITAEVWRLAILLYFQCRLLRLPRNHPSVIGNLTDLAKCIIIMPTSGSHFTTQAPLFPVFLLGLLGTVQAHKNVAIGWFENMIRTPVRSNITSLYESLKRIIPCLDEFADMPEDQELPENLADRQPWWEQVILRAQEQEFDVTLFHSISVHTM